MLWIDDDALKPAAASCLMRLTPLMTEGEWEQMSRTQRACIVRVLKAGATNGRPHWLSDALIDAIIFNVARYGEDDALEPLQQMAKDPDSPHRERAALCISLLLERRARRAHQTTLLRASQPETAAPNALLRPAASASTSPTEQLLRPST